MASYQNYFIADEQPIFIHPGTENPEDFIEFNEDVAVPNDDNKGKTTIEKLGLDRQLLNEKRRDRLNIIKDNYFLTKKFPNFPPELKQESINKKYNNF